MNVRALSPVLGARIEGVDISRPVDDFKTVEAALHEHGFIVFPKQRLDTRQFAAFARRLL